MRVDAAPELCFGVAHEGLPGWRRRWRVPLA